MKVGGSIAEGLEGSSKSPMQGKTARLEFESSQEIEEKLKKYYRNCNKLEFGEPLGTEMSNVKIKIDSTHI